MSYPLTPPNPDRARVERNALLEVERAARERVTPCDPDCKGRQGCPEHMAPVCRALARLDEARKGQG